MTGCRATGPTIDQLVRRATAVLQGNDLGTMVTAAPRLYPHQWSWDAAFITIGLARISVPRAITEMRTLLHAQWDTGMIPHIVFADVPGYFPGPDVWGTDVAGARPDGVQTSGICQPPVHAIAVARILQAGRALGGSDQEAAEAFALESVPKLAAWHRWLSSTRDPAGRGLVEIHHGWESGMDNSPRWDDAYSAISVDRPVELRRHDTKLVTDTSQRPTDREYQRYLHLVGQMRSVRYRDADIPPIIDFRVGDVFMTAILAVAASELAALGAEIGLLAEVADQPAIAQKARDGVLSSISPATGLCRDFDERSGSWTSAQSLASFSALLCGGDPDVCDRQQEIITGPLWAGHPDLAYALPPTVSPAAEGFQPRAYWRGPNWPVMNWLFAWALRRRGEVALADQWRSAGLAQLGDLAFGEYYEPFTGEPLGSRDQSWTAAVALDWAAERG
ncbi:MAG TPA: glycogen debranching protein [Dermatophilaceae bacterium]|nr:glycogen debranching protein [Dermatophilaceae bacterium]